MAENIAYFLDCETKDHTLALTSFSMSLEILLRDFSDWLRSNDCTPADVARANIYRLHDSAWVASLLMEDGAVVLVPRRAYSGPFSGLVHKALFELRLRWRFLRYSLQGRHVSFTEEHVHDDPDD